MLLTWPSEDPSSYGMVVVIVSLFLGALFPRGAQWDLGALDLVLRIPVHGRLVLSLLNR